MDPDTRNHTQTQSPPRSPLLPRLAGAIGRSYRTEGVLGPVRLVGKNMVSLARHYYDSRFDRRYHVDTAGRIDLDLLDIQSPNKPFGLYYEPTPVGVFRKVMAPVIADLGGVEGFKDFTFVDYGCGKGRVLLTASDHPFRRIVGIEFSDELAAAARRNIASYRNPKQRCTAIEALTMDAVDYALPDEDCLVYMANPFHRTLMRQVMANIRRWYERAPRRLYLVYYNPQSADVVASELPFLTRIEERKAVLDFASPRLRGYAVFRSLGFESADRAPQPAPVPEAAGRTAGTGVHEHR